MRRNCEAHGGCKMTFLALALLAMGACDFGGGDTTELGADGSAMAGRDLDGARVAISENEGTTVVRTLNAAWDAAGDGWMIAQDARLKIGEPRGDDDSEALWRVRAAALGAGGTVFVANGGSYEVKAFSPDGGLLWITGGEGAGPGEFQGFQSLHWCSDSVVVADTNARRITRFDAAGEVVDTMPWRSPQRARPAIFHCDSTGTLARIARAGGIQEAPGSFSNAALLAVGTLSGTPTIVGSVGEFDRYRQGNTIMASFLGNSVFVAASDQVVHVVTRDETAISTYDLQGQLVRRAEWDHERRRATAQVLEDEAEFGARTYPERFRAPHIELWEDMEHPDFLPVANDLVAATDGDLWIKQFRLEMEEADSESWWIVSANGALRGVIEIPLGFELLWVGDDAVLGLTVDEDRNQSIEIRALMKPGQ